MEIKKDNGNIPVSAGGGSTPPRARSIPAASPTAKADGGAAHLPTRSDGAPRTARPTSAENRIDPANAKPMNRVDNGAAMPKRPVRPMRSNAPGADPENADSPVRRPAVRSTSSRTTPGGRPIRAVTRPTQAENDVPAVTPESPAQPTTPPRRRQSSALHPNAAGKASDKTMWGPAVSAEATRSIPAINTDDSGEEPSKETDGKKKKDRESLRDRLREEGNNAVISLVKAAIYLVCVLLVAGVISTVVIMVANDVFAFVKADETVTVSVPAGTDVDGLSDILADAGLIKYPSIFRFFAGHEGVADAKFIPEGQEYDSKKESVFIAGTYELNTNLDYEDLIAAFLPPVPTGTSWVTIPEGFTTDEIIDLLVEKGIGKRENYVDVINNYDFDFWFIDELEKNGVPNDRIYRLDGYLFPDTYEFYNASKESTVINKMLVRFAEIFSEDYRELCEEGGYSVDEIVTLASMIEKEAGNASDYFYISEVFRNRLEDPMQYLGTPNPLLQSDATVLYYIHHKTGERPNETTSKDTTMDVPYNTYIYPGLPPGPVSNPSATALVAAMHPSKEGYSYFVTGKKDTYFARSYWEHLNNVNKVANGWE